MTLTSHVGEVQTLDHAWQIVWGASRPEQCFRCGRWTSIQVGATELFWPTLPAQTISFDESALKRMADDQLWRRTLWCSTCYPDFAGHYSYARRGIPLFTEMEDQ